MKPKEFDNYGEAAIYIRENDLDSIVVKVGNEVTHLRGNGRYKILSVDGVAEPTEEETEEAEKASKKKGSKSTGKVDNKKGQKPKEKKESGMTKNELATLAGFVADAKGGSVKEIDSKNQRAIITLNDEDIKLTVKALIDERQAIEEASEVESFEAEEAEELVDEVVDVPVDEVVDTPVDAPKPKGKRGRPKGSGKKQAIVLQAMIDLREFTVKDIAAKVEGITETYAYLVIRDRASVVRKDGKRKVYHYAA